MTLVEMFVANEALSGFHRVAHLIPATEVARRPGAGACMTRSAYVLNLYQWADGDCFRCASRSVLTTLLGEVLAPIGDVYQIRACQTCVLAMEEERRRHAQRHGLPYRPGGLGGPCSP
ncbi:hypothetical protein [Streptomyces chrestomyceticus]|uniref:hypothetical protein n=1 Tax=Streptomyces chrestomyceticus TaxID=68185 RepID=UPI00341183D6